MALILDQLSEQVQALYVAYFGRAGEPDGFNYWLNQLQTGKMSFAEVAASFSQQPEAKAQHAFLANPNAAPEDFIDSLYLQLFNRTPDADGRAYWLAQLDAAKGNDIKIGILIAQFISGASTSNGDAAIIQNKVDAGLLFTSALEEAGIGGTLDGARLDPKYLAIAQDVVDNDITSDPGSIADSRDALQEFLEPLSPTPGGGGSTTPPPTTPTEFQLDLLSAINDPASLVSIKVEGVPAGFVLTNATEVDEGIWIVTAAEADGVTLKYVGSGSPTVAVYELEIVGTLQGGSTVPGTLEVQVAPAGTTFGNLIDGYIAGATVFADANLNGELDAGEVRTVTSFDGSFALVGGSGPLVAFGGTDVLSGLQFEGTLTAPAGSAVVTPLTTLIASLLPANGVASQQEIQDATLKVSQQLGLNTSLNLLTYDPVVGSAAGDATALAVLAAGVQVQTTIVQLSAATGVSAAEALQSLSTVISTSTVPVDLTAASTIEVIAADLSAGSNADEIAAVIATANKSIETASASPSALTEIGKASNIAQGDTTDALGAAYTSTNQDFSTVEAERGDDASLANIIATTPIEQADLDLTGTAGAETISGGTGNDIIRGLGGNDILRGLQGNDDLYGGAGNDNLNGGAGSNNLYGEAGQDRAIYSDSTTGIVVNLAAGTVTHSSGTDRLYSVELVRGSEFDDVIDATGLSTTSPNAASLQASGNISNTIEGGGGDDTIIGSGRTVISYVSAIDGVVVDFVEQEAYGRVTDAGIGFDEFYNVEWARGSDFDDVFIGSDAGNFIIGGAGNDTINGGLGFDTAAYSSLFIDTVTAGINVRMADGIVTGNGTVGTDTLRSVEGIRGTYYTDVYDARGLGLVGASNVTEYGNFSQFEGMAGDDIVIGNGAVRVSYVQSTGSVTVDLTTQTAVGNESVGSDNLQGSGGIAVNNVRGSSYADQLIGGAGHDVFDGWLGDDFIDGKGGYDRADYRLNDQTTTGIDVRMASGIVTSLDPAADISIGIDTLRNIEEVFGTNFADVYDATGYGNNSANTGGVSPTTFNSFEGGGGNDEVIGNGFTRVTYYNATSAIEATLSNGSGTVTTINPLDTSVGTDNLVSGIRYITGSAYNDVIDLGNVFRATGGFGADDITLGSGQNQIEYSETGESFAGSRDVIRNFNATNDQIRFSGALAAELSTTLNFIGSNAFSGAAGEIRLLGNILEIDVNGGASADMQIEFVGLVGTLSDANFVFPLV